MNPEFVWKEIFDAMLDAVCILDKDFNILSCNKAMAGMFGIPEQEIIGKKCWSIVHGTTQPHPNCPLCRMEKTLNRESEEFNIKDRFIEVTVDPILDQSRRLHQCVHIIHDVTDKKMIRNELEENQKQLSAAQKIAGIGHYSLDVASGFWTSSAGLDEIYGIAADHPGNMDGWAALIHPEDREEMLDHLTNGVMKDNKPFNKEYRIIRKSDKAVRWLHALGKLEFGKDGQPVRMFGTIQDITGRKIFENELSMERERLAVTLRSIGDGVITTDPHGCIVFLNLVAEQMTGWSNAEAFGRPLAEVFHIINELTRKPCENPVEKVLKTGLIVELANHTMLISRDGREMILADSGSPIINDRGDVYGVVLVFRDVTEKQKILDTLQQAQKLDSLGILAGGLAHDFNNLLGGIFGYVDLALSGSHNIDKQTSDYLESAMGALSRARSLTQQLLTFAKGGSPQRKAGSLEKTVKESTLFALSGSNVTCRFETLNELSGCEYDENQICQVIDNIVLNAQQSMPAGGTIDVTIRNIQIAMNAHRSLKTGKFVRISIKDYGVGMPKDIIPRIFDPFFTTKQKGHGLGLATAYSIVRKHDGAIDVESEPGKGSCFHVYLPASHGVAEQTRHISDMTAISGTGRILIMDDEDVIRATISRMLSIMGYEAVCVQNGTEALQKLALDRNSGLDYVAIILDLTIPGGLGGREVVSDIRLKDKNIPIIVASGYSDDPVMAKPEEFGFSGSLCKPFTIKELGSTLQRLLMRMDEKNKRT